MEASNVKAMREAVKTALDELLLWNYTDRDTARMALGVVNKLDAALSAPPRNCDIPLIVDEAADNVADKAWLAFRRCNPNVYFDVSGLLGCIKWLFDEAKGAKE